MTGSASNDKPLAADANDESRTSARSDGQDSRRPYCAPKLRHLGSVRELTLGGTAGMSEGGGTFMTM